MVLVYKNKEAIQVERPQRFIDLDAERRDQIADSSSVKEKEEISSSKLEA
jgi:hypothetical protein